MCFESAHWVPCQLGELCETVWVRFGTNNRMKGTRWVLSWSLVSTKKPTEFCVWKPCSPKPYLSLWGVVRSLAVAEVKQEQKCYKKKDLSMYISIIYLWVNGQAQLAGQRGGQESGWMSASILFDSATLDCIHYFVFDLFLLQLALYSWRPWCSFRRISLHPGFLLRASLKCAEE